MKTTELNYNIYKLPYHLKLDIVLMRRHLRKENKKRTEILKNN